MSERYRLFEAEKAFETPVKVSCELLGVSRSGYYDWERRVPCQRDLEDAWITEKIKDIHRENRGSTGRQGFTRSSGWLMGSGSGRNEWPGS